MQRTSRPKQRVNTEHTANEAIELLPDKIDNWGLMLGGTVRVGKVNWPLRSRH